LGITHAAIGLSSDQRQRTVGDAKALAPRDLTQTLDDFPQADSTKVVALTP